jgi:hypothetical protein
MTDYLEKRVLDLIFRNANASATVPLGLDSASVWVGFFTDSAGTSHETGTGTEVASGGYARVAVARSGSPGWTAAAGSLGTTGNSGSIAFTTATGSWGTVNQFGIFDALTGGNLLYWGDLGSPRTIGAGDTATFAAGAITITQD